MQRRLVRRATLTTAAGLLASAAAVAPMALNASASTTKTPFIHIKIVNFMFTPMTVKVNPGELIKVTNFDTVAHTLTAVHREFNTGKIGHDQTKSFRAPKKPGTYHYICNIHQFMTGTLVVK